MQKPEEPASKPRCARIRAPWSPWRVIRYTASPSCKLPCLIFSDQGDPPPSLNLSHCPLATSPSLFARCVGIGESGFASSLYVIYSELNRHGISRKRENADFYRRGTVRTSEDRQNLLGWPSGARRKKTCHNSTITPRNTPPTHIYAHIHVTTVYLYVT